MPPIIETTRKKSTTFSRNRFEMKKRRNTNRTSSSREYYSSFSTRRRFCGFVSLLLVSFGMMMMMKTFVAAEQQQQQRNPPPPRRAPPPPTTTTTHPPRTRARKVERYDPPPPPPEQHAHDDDDNTNAMHDARDIKAAPTPKDEPPVAPPPTTQQRRQHREEKKRMTPREYMDARKERKPRGGDGGKKNRNVVSEAVSTVVVPTYRFIVGFPKASVRFVLAKCSSTRVMFRTNTIGVLTKLFRGKMHDGVNTFGSYLADVFLFVFTLAIARVVHLFTPFAKPPPPSVKSRKVGSDRVRIQFHMPFAGGADKCIVFLKGDKVLCRCPEKMLECETTLSKPAKGSTWIIFEEPKWVEYKDELVVVAKCVKKDRDAKKIEKMPLKTPAARKKSVSRTAKSDDEGDRAPARSSRKKTPATKAKKTPATRSKSPVSPRRTRQTPAKRK